jgi:hypothetical protein
MQAWLLTAMRALLYKSATGRSSGSAVEGGEAGLRRPLIKPGGESVEQIELKTSIGIVYVEAGGRDWFSIQGPFVSEPHEHDERAFPHVHMTFDNRDGQWAPERNPAYYAETRISAPMPEALLSELSTLGIEWADGHPEEFERAGRADFDDLIGYITQDTFNDLLHTFKEVSEHFRAVLSEPEFERYASTALRRRMKQEAQRTRVMRSQISGAAKAIRTLADKCLAKEVA